MFPSDLLEALDARGREIFAAANPPDTWTYRFTNLCTGLNVAFCVHFDMPNGYGLLRLEPGDGDLYGPFSVQTWDRSANSEYRNTASTTSLAEALAEHVGALLGREVTNER